MDISCCHEEGANIGKTTSEVVIDVLARQILLYTILIDNAKNSHDNKRYFSMLYDFYTTPEALEIVREQSSKLLGISSTLQPWQSSEYGKFINICSENTLTSVRQCWEEYAKPPITDESQLKQYTSAIARRLASKDIANLTPTFGAVGLESIFHAVAAEAEPWATAAKVSSASPTTSHPNPLLVYSLRAGYTFAIPRSTSKYAGFHLAYAFSDVELYRTSKFLNICSTKS